MKHLDRSRRAAIAGAILAIALWGMAPASAHTHGASSPSWVASTGTSTLADDNVTDGHCVYVSYKRTGSSTVYYDGAKSCGPTETKSHSPHQIINYRACVTGHWGDAGCQPWKL